MGVPALVGVESTQSVLVWSTGDFGGGTGDVASWLCASGESDSASFLGRDTGVTIDALGPSDEVLFFTNGRGDPNNGDVLADFADTGKRLVLATFSWADQGSNTLGGRMINEGINPLVAQGSTRHSGVSIASADGSLRWDGVAYQRFLLRRRLADARFAAPRRMDRRHAAARDEEQRHRRRPYPR